MIVEEPVRGSFAYLEQPGLLWLPAVDQLWLFIERRLPAPPHHAPERSGRREGLRRRHHTVDPREPVIQICGMRRIAPFGRGARVRFMTASG